MEIIRYDKSHLAKLTCLSDKMKMYYEQLKNHILSYAKIKNSISWDGERFYLGRNTLIRFLVRGKSINVYLALTPSTIDAKYNIVDVSDIKKYQDLPTLIKMKGPRSFAYTKELVDQVMNEEEIDYVEEFAESYSKELKMRSINELVKEGLAKPVYGNKASTSSEIDLDDDSNDEEEEVLATKEAGYEIAGLSKEQVGRSLREVINLDIIECNYDDGEIVSLDTLKDKGLIDINIMYVKLLATGTLTKKVSIRLNAYSKEAKEKLDKLYA